MINEWDISHSRREISREGRGKIRLIRKLYLVGVFVMFSGFEFDANLDAIQHTGVCVLLSGFEFNANLNAIQHTGVFALRYFSVLNLMQILMLSNIQVFLHYFWF
jgi:hypothetical protein